jgi:hypothetical protein
MTRPVSSRSIYTDHPLGERQRSTRSEKNAQPGSAANSELGVRATMGQASRSYGKPLAGWKSARGATRTQPGILHLSEQRQGKFKMKVNVGRSLAADRRRKAKTAAPKGQRDRGD